MKRVIAQYVFQVKFIRESILIYFVLEQHTGTHSMPHSATLHIAYTFIYRYTYKYTIIQTAFFRCFFFQSHFDLPCTLCVCFFFIIILQYNKIECSLIQITYKKTLFTSNGEQQSKDVEINSNKKHCIKMPAVV